MEVSLIVAVDEERVIGRAGGLPWRLPADLRHFKQTTMGKPVIMGRRTYESLGRPLKGRENIVLSRNPGYRAAGCTVVTGPEEALKAAQPAGEVMVLGGARVYEAFLPLADRIYLTRVHARVPGDTYFPEIDADRWKVVSSRSRAADAENPYDMTFQVLERSR